MLFKKKKKKSDINDCKKTIKPYSIDLLRNSTIIKRTIKCKIIFLINTSYYIDFFKKIIYNFLPTQFEEKFPQSTM